MKSADKLGNELAPHIQQVTDDLAAWFKNGGLEKIRTIRDDALPAPGSTWLPGCGNLEKFWPE